MIDLADKVSVITGASSGIGAVTAKALARKGSTVVLAARRKGLLDELAENIVDRGGRASVFPTDVTRIEDLEALRAHVASEHGRCDVLINNAGVPGGGAFSELSVERIRMVTETNYVSVLLATKVFLEMLLESRGHIVNVASLAGRFALPGAGVYAASKHAVVAFTQSASYDKSLERVRFTAVCPGFVKTPGFPHENPPWFVTVSVEKVAAGIADVIERRREGVVSIPAWPGPLSAVQVVAPWLYRKAVSVLADRYSPRVHTD